ncbi:MFS family permease [Luteibacter sp. Sphag1AF]|uniref:MFS transporter n=1 Tax=Luteibacter sp. Sphag1AF TaxID=2587031 RepID=UPI0016088DA3|nr:MFS transporter [Luteibacter sp. Sphag1AF]MBB3227090.1 MFS family permease [Luteibacter sp. Sphag1AF]
MSVSTSETPFFSAPDAAHPEGLLSPRYRAATLGMVALISLIAFEALAVTTAMPAVARELDGLKLYALAFGGTLATSVIGMTLAGRWSDIRGPGLPLWSGLACFVTGLLLAGFAPTMDMLLLGRLVQGLGAGGMSVALYVVVGRLYPEVMRPKIFAAFSAGWVVPSMIGPAVSGLIVQSVGWRWVFLGVPLLAVPAAVILRPALSQLPAMTPGARPSARAVYLAFGAAVGVCLVFIAGQQQGWVAAAVLVPAVALLGGCARSMLPAGTLRAARGLPSVILLRGLAASAFFGCEAFLPLLLSREHGLSPLWSGMALSAGALGWFSGSWYQGHYATMSREALLKLGTGALTVGVAVTASAAWPVVPVAVSIAGWALTGLGMGLLYASLSVLMLKLSPPEEQGANSSALQLCESVTVATTLAVGGSLFAALIASSSTGAFLANFALAGVLAVLGMVVARRTHAR